MQNDLLKNYHKIYSAESTECRMKSVKYTFVVTKLFLMDSFLSVVVQ